MLLISKCVSLILVLGFLVATSSAVGWRTDSWLMAAGFTLPLALIWYPREMGALTGHYRARGTRPTASMLASISGWLLLLAALATVVTVSGCPL